MIYTVGEHIIRPFELDDVDSLYLQKNNYEIAALLGGFSTGYSRSDLSEWIEFHRKKSDELLWAIADKKNNVCVGHVGFYKIDYRVGSAEIAVMIGQSGLWGKGLGRRCIEFMIGFGFNELNFNRIYLSVLSTNQRAIQLYRQTGFVDEGVLRQAQYKNSHYIDLVLMGLLREEYTRDEKN